jgi:hypothetical protein
MEEREREKSGSADTASVLLSFLPYAIHPSFSIAPKTIFLLGDRGRQFGAFLLPFTYLLGNQQ